MKRRIITGRLWTSHLFYQQGGYTWSLRADAVFWQVEFIVGFPLLPILDADNPVLSPLHVSTSTFGFN
jgi:hypothetical protein